MQLVVRIPAGGNRARRGRGRVGKSLAQAEFYFAAGAIAGVTGGAAASFDKQGVQLKLQDLNGFNPLL